MLDDLHSRGREFAQLAKCLLAARGKAADAAYFAENLAASPRVRSVLKALPGTAMPGSPGWGSELVDYQILAEGFFASLRYAGVFDALLPHMRRLPMRTRIVAASLGASGASPSEGAEKPVSQLTLASGQLALLKAIAIIVVSGELARASGSAGTDFINGELRGAVATETDAAFITAITAGVSPIASTGTDASAARADLQAGLFALGLGAQSRPHILMDAETALALAFMENSDGSAAFPDMGMTGGAIGGTPALVTNGIPDALTSPSTSSLVLVDAASIAADAGEITLAQAAHATLDLGDGPVSLWQNNLTGLRAERWFGAEVARPNTVSVINGVAYGEA